MKLQHTSAQVEGQKKYFSKLVPIDDVTYLTQGLQKFILTTFIEWDDGETWSYCNFNFWRDNVY